MTDFLATTTLTDPQIIQMRQDIADQMHSQRPGILSNAVVLTESIADITFNLSVQGASFLDVLIIDPFGKLTSRVDKNGNTFIDTDPDGILLPILLEFPKGSGRSWYLAACEETSDLSQGNLKLTFEDRAVDVLRNLDGQDGPAQSQVNETRLKFIQRLLKVGNIVAKTVFSQATISFEQSPPSLTPPQVAAWDKQWTAQQRQKQNDAWNKWFNAQFNQKFNQQFNQNQQKIHSLSTPDQLFNTNSTYAQEWWAYQQSGHVVSVPKAVSNPYGVPPAGFQGGA